MPAASWDDCVWPFAAINLHCITASAYPLRPGDTLVPSVVTWQGHDGDNRRRTHRPTTRVNFGDVSIQKQFESNFYNLLKLWRDVFECGVTRNSDCSRRIWREWVVSLALLHSSLSTTSHLRIKSSSRPTASNQRVPQAGSRWAVRSSAVSMSCAGSTAEDWQ